MFKRCTICGRVNEPDMFMMFLDKKIVGGVVEWHSLSEADIYNRIKEDIFMEEFLICIDCYKHEVL